MKKYIKLLLIILIFVLGFIVSLHIESNYPISKEDVSQNFYIAIYCIKNIFVFLGMGVCVYIVKEILND